MPLDAVQSLTTGVDTVMTNDNIAIVVLMTVTVFEAVVIIALLKTLLKTKDVLSDVNNALTILNERLK